MAKILRALLVILMLTLLSGCGRQKDIVTGVWRTGAHDKETASGSAIDQDLSEFESGFEAKTYIVESVDEFAGEMVFAVADSPRMYTYPYTKATRLLDKFGDYVPITHFTPGKVVEIKLNPEGNELNTVRMNDDVWNQTGITRYSIDTENRRIQIGDTKYTYDSNLRIFSNDEEIYVSQIGEQDVLEANGLGKKILSISIERGTGTIAFINTGLFEGGWINLGTKIYAVITKDMTMEVPEGVYNLTVANKGWGDSTEIEVERGNILTVDLDELKGDGPQICELTLKVYTKNARIYIDGKRVDHTKPVSLSYGVYPIKVTSPGEEDWERKIVVHSHKATIIVGEEPESPETDEYEVDDNIDDSPEIRVNPTQSSENTGGTSDNNNNNDSDDEDEEEGGEIVIDFDDPDDESDSEDEDLSADDFPDDEEGYYLDTLSDLVSSLTNR
ncbi:MAG: hypothetical protein K6E56_04440 [Lachnospiraceae bacterium]|nr:hypothetical protein [Lachnospiraceae bacterium]